MQNPPINPGEFEEEVRRSVLLEKLQSALTDWITVADADVTTEFNRRNEKVKLAVVAFPADKFKDSVAVTDAEVASHFEANKDTYKIPEKRKIKYALIDLQTIRQRTTVSAQDVQRYYEDNQQQYSTPEQVRASHILLKTEGKDDAAVKKQAEDALAKVKGGADFAALAGKSLGGRRQRRAGRRAQGLRQGRLDGQGVRRRSVCAQAWRNQRPREVPVRLPHHPASGEEGSPRPARSTSRGCRSKRS